MKCPKCSYVSFDYNLSCPKCSKDISAEQSKLNIPAFRPEAPFLLGALTGHSDENNTSHSGAGSSPMGLDGGTRRGRDDSPGSEREEIAFEESEVLDLGAGEGMAPHRTADFDLGREAKPVALKESPIEDLALESETLTIEQVDEDDILKEAEGPAAAAGGDESEEIDLNALDLDMEEGEPGEGKEGIHLSLDDLKVGESGELGIGKQAGGDVDKRLEIDELTLDEIPLGDELSLEESEEKAEAAKPDMGDEGETIDLDDLGLDLDLEEEEKRV